MRLLVFFQLLGFCVLLLMQQGLHASFPTMTTESSPADEETTSPVSEAEDGASEDPEPATTATTPVPYVVNSALPDVERTAATTGVPITLGTAAALAQTSNWDITFAREQIEQTRPAIERARALILPNLNIGPQYNTHYGQIQRVEGSVIRVDRVSLFAGGSANINVAISDAVFQPLVAKQLNRASKAGYGRVTLDTVVSVVEAYLTLMRLKRRLARIDQTLDFLVSPNHHPLRDNAKGLLPLLQTWRASRWKFCVAGRSVSERYKTIWWAVRSWPAC
jgi:hypothetical protein